MSEERLKIDVSEENLLLDYPEPCSYCLFPAHTVFFVKIKPPNEGISLALRQTEAKCIDHLSYEDMMVESVRGPWD
jgi:hypothetical protein